LLAGTRSRISAALAWEDAVSEPLLHAIAQALADGRRVLILGDSFDLVERLAAAPVKELVVVTALADPEAPVGSTVGGAPLRLRLDWNERQNSKDLIVDAAGEAPADEVARVLKKAGIYLTLHPDAPALARLPEQRWVQVGAASVLLAGTAPPPEVVLPEDFALPEAHEDLADPADPAEDAPADAAHLTALVAQVGALEAQNGDFAAQISALEAQNQALQAQNQALQAQSTTAADHLRALEDRIAQQARALEAAESLAQRTLELEESVASAQQRAAEQRMAHEAALAALRRELDEQAADYETVRAELAERRITDRRSDSVRTRFEAARLEMSREIETLRAQVRELGEPAEDVASLVGERDEARRAHDEVTEVVEAGLRELGADLPAAPPSYAGDGPRGAWLHAVRHALGVAAAELGRLRHRRIELESQLEGLWIALRERDEALAAAEEASPAAPPAPSAPLEESALLAQVTALEAALAAERQIRAAEGQAWRQRIQAAERVLAERGQLLQALAEARQEAARGRLRVAAGEEQQRRLQAERLLRDERITDLEVMLVTHTRMQTLLTEALTEAEAARDEAESDRRMLDANVRLLQQALAERTEG
jgi:DNA repair exonuclease SbcCD ATPase subunit